ncbi:MAG TPA: ECF-type sigma factor [Phycisphaerae bacterium]
MNDVTRILAAIESGESLAAEELMPAIYAELRRLAARQMAGEPAGLAAGSVTKSAGFCAQPGSQGFPAQRAVNGAADARRSCHAPHAAILSSGRLPARTSAGILVRH